MGSEKTNLARKSTATNCEKFGLPLGTALDSGAQREFESRLGGKPLLFNT
jgi:hypothetical protein